MTPDKALLETAIKCRNLMRDLPVHEKAAVLGIIGSLLQSEAKSLEMAHLQPLVPPSPPVNDEHYRA